MQNKQEYQEYYSSAIQNLIRFIISFNKHFDWVSYLVRPRLVTILVFSFFLELRVIYLV